jgi:hypothetical protein
MGIYEKNGVCFLERFVTGIALIEDTKCWYRIRIDYGYSDANKLE